MLKISLKLGDKSNKKNEDGRNIDKVGSKELLRSDDFIFFFI